MCQHWDVNARQFARLLGAAVVTTWAALLSAPILCRDLLDAYNHDQEYSVRQAADDKFLGGPGLPVVAVSASSVGSSAAGWYGLSEAMLRTNAREAATGSQRNNPGAALAHVLDEIGTKHIDNGFAAITVMVWSEALRSPALAAQLAALRGEMGAYYGGLATDIRLPTGVPGESFATVLGSISAGFILQLALFGPDAAEDLPATARALWPAAKARSVRSPVTTRSNTQTR